MLQSAVQEEQLEKCFGKYPGLVLENAAPDGETHVGELLVEVSGILEEDPGGKGQRPIQVWAKPCFFPGFFFIPEVGGQVWIEFIAGNINQPLWTGVWYPTEAVPQTAEGQGPTQFQKIIRTASGHVMELDDTEDEEKIVIRHKTDTTCISIDQDGHILIEHADGMTIEIKEDNTIAINCGTMTITADDGMTITADVTIEGNTTMNGTLTVGDGPSTTIDGNTITGG
jgi:hypothetical protein